MNDDELPFKIVFDKNFETTKVMNMLKMIKQVKIKADSNPDPLTPFCTKNIDIMAIKRGNLPLHGVNEFVNIAISLSLAESIILAPSTPTALHPKPKQTVRACFPQADTFLKYLSRLNATLGR